MIDIKKSLSKNEAWLISNQLHIQYLTGFVSLVPTHREALLLIRDDRVSLIHAAFSPTPSPEEVPKTFRSDLEFLSGTHPSRLRDHLGQLFAGLTKLTLDPQTLWQNEYELISELIRAQAPQCQLVRSPQLEIDQARALKSGAEIKVMRRAGEITREVFAQVRAEIKADMSEQDVCQLIEVKLRERGSLRPAFPTIVAFDDHTTLAHHQPQADKILKPEQAVLLDFGATYDHYHADCTRSWWFGQEAPRQYREIEKAVTLAYGAGVALLVDHYQVEALTENQTEVSPTLEAKNDPSGARDAKDQISASDLDKVVRDLIIEAGFGPNFYHTSGHGLGLEIHEQPSISQYNQNPLQKSMIITLEPGIYLEGQFGVRHENTLLLK